MQDEDEEGEPRYCYCNEVSFGDMIGCDNDACPREWFHLSCVGLTKPPATNGEFQFQLQLGFIVDWMGLLTLNSEMVLQGVQGEYATQSEWAVGFH